MTPVDRKHRALALFDTLCDLDPSSRAARLTELALQDAELAREVSKLLAADAASDPILDGAPLISSTLLRSPGMQFGVAADRKLTHK